MSSIKNVTLTGASGDLGKVVLAKFLSIGRYNIRVLRRAGSSATYPGLSSDAITDVDFSSVEALTAALQGQDAVICTLGSEGLLTQLPLIEAAVAAGVQRFVPSEYGCDLEIPAVRELPVFGHKVQVEDTLSKLAKTTSLTYTLLYNMAFFDWGLEHNFILDLSNFKPTIFNDGETRFAVNRLSSVADALVAILEHPEETKNRSVRIQEASLTQNRILAIAKEVAPEKPWSVQHADVDERLAAAFARLNEGTFDEQVIFPMLIKGIMDPASGSYFTKPDNEVLGLKTMTDEEVAQVIKNHVKTLVSASA